MSLRNTIPTSLFQESISEIRRGRSGIREFKTGFTIDGGSLEEEGSR
jgi:hypothetical protein